ncbi:MAG: MerR family transcriptional regulator [Eggerthellaceae bacterium]|nr:MerR family transcriptional regulator [Eggerthellaceae bacterium]
MPEKTYTVKQVAQMSGTSIRALHHYESIGLLKPARRASGYREYGSADLERLQLILLYRACNMKLSDIRELLDDPAYDAKAALNRHLDVLSAQKQELEQLISTVRKTLRSMEGDCEMTDEERFEGLKRSTIEANEAKYGAEARQAWGDAAVDAANEKLLTMEQKEFNDMNELETAIAEQLKTAMATKDASSAESHELASMHEQWIRMHWGNGAYSREAHLGLAKGYLADERFRAYYDDRAGEGATEFLVQALEAYLA